MRPDSYALPHHRRLSTAATSLAGLAALSLASTHAQDGPFPQDDWPASADGEATVHFTTTDFGLSRLGDGWDETLTILSGGDQATQEISIGGLDAVKVTGEYLNVADFDYTAWNDHEFIDVLVQVYGNEAVLDAGGNPRNYQFLTGTLPELNDVLGGSIPVEGQNNRWNWVLFTIPNDFRPSGGGRYVGFVPDGAQGNIDAGGVNGGTIRIQNVPGWIVRAVAFGAEGAFGTAEQINRFFEPEECAPEALTNHVFVDIDSGESQNLEVLSGGDQVSSIADDIGPEGDKRRAVRAEGDYLNFGITEEFLGAACSAPRTVKVCIEYYDDPEMAFSVFGPQVFATDDQGGLGFVDPSTWKETLGSGEWVRQSYTIPAVSLAGVNTAPLTGGPRFQFDPGSNVYISRVDIAVLRVGDHPLAGMNPLENCFADPGVCSGEYGVYAEMDLQEGIFDGIFPGNSGGDQEMIEEEAGPESDRRLAVRAAHDDGTPGFNHNFLNFAIVDEPFGPSSQPNAHLAICVTYWDNPELAGATFRPEVYRSERDGVETFAFVDASEAVPLAGTGTWREAYFEIPDVKFTGVNQSPQAAARFVTSDKIHFARVQYGVIRPCGPTAGVNPLEACKPQEDDSGFQIIEIRLDDVVGEITISWPSQVGRTYTVQGTGDLVTWADLATGYPTGGATGETTSITLTKPAATGTYHLRVAAE